jgi:DNA uptake protein ComE-like DNA-binding protein
MPQIPWWVWVSATPMGLGAWSPLVPARQLRRPWWTLWGVLFTLCTIAGWVWAIQTHGDRGGAGGLIILGWVGALATALSIRPAYLRETSSGFTLAREQAEQRLQERKTAIEIAEHQPALAQELGIGRPDRPGAQSAGLVDVNNAPASALVTLPGIDDALATRIVEVRAQVNGFSSLADFGGVLDLDGDLVERLRDRTVFLPR